MPTTRRSRVLAAEPDRVWRVVRDPHHLPRWWPRVGRVEGVAGDRWTSVLMTSRGRPVRADFRVVDEDAPRRRRWRQELEGSPFERLLSEAVTEVALENADGGTRVTLVSRQRLRGLARFGGLLVRRATGRQLDEALDGLERASGG